MRILLKTFLIKNTVVALVALTVLTLGSCNGSSSAEKSEKFTVSFAGSGGQPNPIDQEITSGGYIAQPGVMTAPSETPDYVFSGWYTDYYYTTEWDFNKNTVEKEMTLYARWVFDVGPLAGTWKTDENNYAAIDAKNTEFTLVSPVYGASLSRKGTVTARTETEFTVSTTQISNNGGATWINSGGNETYKFIIADNSITLETGSPPLTFADPGDGNILKFTSSFQNSWFIFEDVEKNTEYSFRIYLKGDYMWVTMFSNSTPEFNQWSNVIDGEKFGDVASYYDAGTVWTERTLTFTTKPDTNHILLMFRPDSTDKVNWSNQPSGQVGKMELYKCSAAEINDIEARGENIFLQADSYFLNRISEANLIKGWNFELYNGPHYALIPGSKGDGQLLNSDALIDNQASYGPYPKEDL